MDEQQASCAKCEALKKKAIDEHYDNKQDLEQRFAELLMEIDLEHERGEHAEDSG